MAYSILVLNVSRPISDNIEGFHNNPKKDLEIKWF